MNYNEYAFEKECDDEYEFKVVGVTFNNDDNTSRQEILKKIKNKESPFDGKINYSLRVYSFEGRPAVAVEANGVMIGNIPKENAAFVAEQIENIQNVYVHVYGGGKKKDGGRKSFGAEATLQLNTTIDESIKQTHNVSQYSVPQYNMPKHNTHQQIVNVQNSSGVGSFISKLKSMYYSQFEIKDNSPFDEFAKWIDKTFFGSNYNLISEKLMIIALITNILGLHRVYAGHKLAAAIGWLFLLVALQSRGILLMLLVWVLIDMILICFGDYGRLKGNQKLDFNKFKALLTYKASIKGKVISFGISLAVMTFIFVVAPIAPDTNETPNFNTNAPNNSVNIVSLTDQSTVSITDTPN